MLETLTAFFAEREIEAASILGIGAVEGVQLGYYELKTHTYHLGL